jgi:transcriptional regulator with XRE-family HTH domain
MDNYKKASEAGQEIILSFFKKRMKEIGVSQENLSETLGVSVSTLWRYFKKETPMPLGVYLEICGALKLRPYLIPAEDDANEMMRVHFN